MIETNSNTDELHPPVRRKSFGLILFLFFILLLIAAAIAGFVFANAARSAFSRQSDDANSQTIEVTSGETIQQLSTNLASDGQIPSAFWMRVYIRLHPEYGVLKIGEYVLPPHQTIRQIVLQLHSSATQQNTLLIPEGSTINEIAADIAAHSNNITQNQVITAEQELATQYGFLGQSAPDPITLEGYLFPDTYFISVDDTATSILQKMLDNENQKITPQMLAEIHSNNMTPQQIITIASLIEKEIGTSNGVARDPNVVQQERKTVAGIIYNRLKLGMPLQLDSTKNYVQPGQSQPDPSYNTYVISGLPPGPICNPSLDSIEAAINPTQSSYLYFITDKTGTAHFATTIQQHDANIAEYLNK